MAAGSFVRTIEHVESVTKVIYVDRKAKQKIELTADEYRDEWCEALYDVKVIGRKYRLTHNHTPTLDGYYLASQSDDGIRWKYEIHWKE